jgi:hypothetical protein
MYRSGLTFLFLMSTFVFAQDSVEKPNDSAKEIYSVSVTLINTFSDQILEFGERELLKTDVTGPYRIRIINGDASGQHRASAIRVYLNGKEARGAREISPGVGFARLRPPSDIYRKTFFSSSDPPKNKLRLKIEGPPGAQITLSIEDISAEVQQAIESVLPALNGPDKDPTVDYSANCYLVLDWTADGSPRTLLAGYGQPLGDGKLLAIQRKADGVYGITADSGLDIISQKPDCSLNFVRVIRSLPPVLHASFSLYYAATYNDWLIRWDGKKFQSLNKEGFGSIYLLDLAGNGNKYVISAEGGPPDPCRERGQTAYRFFKGTYVPVAYFYDGGQADSGEDCAHGVEENNANVALHQKKSVLVQESNFKLSKRVPIQRTLRLYNDSKRPIKLIEIRLNGRVVLSGASLAGHARRAIPITFKHENKIRVVTANQRNLYALYAVVD